MYEISEAEHLMLHEKADKHAKLLVRETNGGASDGEEYREAFYDFVADLVTRRFDPAHESGASLETYVERALECHRIEVKKQWRAKDAHNVSLEREVKARGEGEEGVTIGETLAAATPCDATDSRKLYLEVCRGLGVEQLDQLWAMTIAEGNVEFALALLALRRHYYGRSTFYAKILPALKEKVKWLIRH